MTVVNTIDNITVLVYNEIMDKPQLTITVAAARLGLTRQAVHLMIKDGRLKAKLEHGRYFINHQSFNSMLFNRIADLKAQIEKLEATE